MSHQTQVVKVLSFLNLIFKLKDDGDSAIVRIMAESKADIDANYIHEVEVDGRTVKVSCLRNAEDPTAVCPLCDSGVKPVIKTYIHFIEYVEDETGKLVGVPSLFERSKDYIEKLTTLIDEYAPLHTNVFKIVRRGKAGDKDTKYEFLLQPATKYNSETHPYFEDDLDFTPALGSLIQEKSAQDLSYYLSTGKFPTTEKIAPTKTTSGYAAPTPRPQPQAQPVQERTGFAGPRSRV